LFKINFKAVDDFNELKLISPDKFDSDYRDIEGIIELDFCGNKYGYYFDDCPFGEERLLWWFKDLLTLVIKIENSDYVAYHIPETLNFWIEFISEGDTLIVSLVEDIVREALLDSFINQPYPEFKYVDWNNVRISKAQFKNEIISNTQKLIHFIEILNPQLLKSNSVQELVILFKEASNF
jgi:hypothetical protein